MQKPWQWFKKWFKIMPLPWQEGLIAAQKGGAFAGDLEDKHGDTAVVVYFVHPSLGKRVEEALTGAPIFQKSSSLPIKGPI